MTQIPCPMCGSSNAQFLRSIVNRDPMTESAFPKVSVSICRDCGLVHQNPRISKDAMMDLYQMLEDKAGGGVTFHESESRLAALQALTPPPATVLEVGCSDGTFLGLAGMAGYQVTGLDPSRANLNKARKTHPGSNLHEGFLESFESDERYDVICHFYVLEYSFDPRCFLTAAHRLLKPNGIMLLEVPDAATFSRLPFANSLFTHQDVTIFTATTLRAMLSATGFTVSSINSGQASKRYGIRIAASPGHDSDLYASDYEQGFAAMTRYFDCRDEMLALVERRVEIFLDQVRADTGPVVVFGAGENGRIITNTSLGRDGRKLFFCDNNTDMVGLNVDGHEVIAPQDVPKLNPSLVIAASIDYQDDMVQQMLELGVEMKRIVRLYAD